MKNIRTSSAFTLVEMLVSMTIFSLIMVAVFTVFIYSTTMSGKIELERNMQENIKSVLDTLGEDIRTGNIDTSSLPTGVNFVSQDSLIVDDFEYYLGNKDGTVNTNCVDIQEVCYFLKAPIIGGSIDITQAYPLSNSFTAFENLKFHVSNEGIPKVTVTFTARPAIKKGVRSAMIEKSRIDVQTTFTERVINFE